MKVLITNEGNTVGVYSDRTPVHGKQTVTRASTVEYNNHSREWEAVLPNGKMIAHGLSRDQVIKDEIAYLEKHLHEL